MFFSLVANDRSHFDGLLRWTEQNLAGGNLSRNLPAWLWGHGSNNLWGVLDKNSASDADIWMTYTLLEAGKAWNEPRYTKIGTGLAHQIADREIANVPGLGHNRDARPNRISAWQFVSAIQATYLYNSFSDSINSCPTDLGRKWLRLSQ